MPYKDPNKRKELIKKHYNSNKEYYKKKANKWKAQNKDKVKESRIRYSEKKKIINELTELQEIYFKSYDGRNDKKFDDKFLNNEILEIFKKIIYLQYYQINNSYPDEKDLHNFCKLWMEKPKIKNMTIFNLVFIQFIKNLEPEKKEYGYSVKYFNSRLYNFWLDILKERNGNLKDKSVDLNYKAL